MTYLLDVNMLIAAIWRDHQDQPRVEGWLRRKQTAACPISELGFLRISSGETFPFRAEPQINAEMLFRNFFGSSAADSSDDFSPQQIAAQSSRDFTDRHPAELAEQHRMKLATLDTRIFHRAVEIVR